MHIRFGMRYENTFNQGVYFSPDYNIAQAKLDRIIRQSGLLEDPAYDHLTLTVQDGELEDKRRGVFLAVGNRPWQEEGFLGTGETLKIKEALRPKVIIQHLKDLATRALEELSH